MPYNRKMGLRSPRSATRTRSFGPKTYNNNRYNTGRRPRGQYIDPAKFVRSAKPVEAERYSPTHNFADFEIDALIKTNLRAKGYEIPSPIQDQTIPLALTGNDIIGIANTGTGKTAAFAVPILNKLINERDQRALIIAPTRELAQQIEEECRSIAKGCGLSGTVLIGGTNMGGQLRDLRFNPRVVIGTPGRIKDHIERGSLKLERFNTVVLDEVDRMLDMGFVNDVRYILSHLSNPRQSFFFSATVDSKINNLIQTFSSDPKTVTVKTGQTSDNVNQNIVKYQASSDKMDKLHNILNSQDVEKTIVFEETKRSVERLSKELVARGFSADAIHGGKTQGQRQRALKRFKNSEINILVATDVAARGIDVADITHVINYSTPQTYDDYVHRIGRAGRAGRVGHALTFVQ
ncbi:MAG TPA: DEAD/DEAH box helicase [Candidatus Saccharimonadales bacterium]|nr:DEAD/DEAH box helicase [Candidatus Saccharimonadales bacterium]